MSLALHELIAKVQDILSSPASKSEAKALARQLLFLTVPLSHVVELYLYDNEGRPQNLEKFQMMRQIYDKTPQRLLLKCSRKTLKSTLLSNMIALNMLRYKHYKMLYIAPQELSTKYFSNNYLNIRFDSPPLKRIIQGFSRNDVFEKILQDTNSSVILRYCKEDASRIRGPAVDQLYYDECVSASTSVICEEGERKLLDLRVGDKLICFDDQRQPQQDTIKAIKSRGKRPTWRLLTKDGHSIECTSREKILTNRGWLYLAQLLPECEINRCEKAKSLKVVCSEVKPFFNGSYDDIEACTYTSNSEIASIEYIGEQDVYDVETEKYHTFFANGIAVHNCQDVSLEVLPIIKETLTLSPFKREVFAGTPLTTDNTINELWKSSSQCEWLTKCTSCNHWNGLTPENDPIKMVQLKGLCCSRCDALLDTNNGEWVEYNPGKYDLIGYHLAQPILSYFNQHPKEWSEIYKKVWGTGANKYSMGQIYNEVFGLAYDTGCKPITEEQLKKLSVIGDMDTAYQRNKHKYLFVTCGVDWGVNMDTSRTAICLGGLREDGIYEVFFARILKDFDYEKHIVEIADLVNCMGAYCACDSGPDVARGKKLADMTSWQKTQLVRYEDGLLIQQYKTPANSMHPSQNRWCLHRSDTMTFTFDMLKKEKVLFCNWEQISECLGDILNVFIEVKEGVLRQELVYRHPATKPDDFFHALNFALCQAHLLAGNPMLSAPSSTALTAEWLGGIHG